MHPWHNPQFLCFCYLTILSNVRHYRFLIHWICEIESSKNEITCTICNFFVSKIYLNSSWLFIYATRSLTAWMKSSCPAISLVTTENWRQLYRAKIDNIAATWCSRLGANCNCSLAWDWKESCNFKVI